MGVYRNKIVFEFLVLTFLFLAIASDSFGQAKCLTEDEVKKIVDGIKSQQSVSLNKKLQQELLDIREDTALLYEDLSRLVSDSKSLEERLKRQQAANTLRLCQILKEHGWTSKALVGADASGVVPLIFTDSPSLEFQQQLAPVMQAAFEAGEISKSNYARILDQLRVRTGKKQIFGTLVGISKDLLFLYPVENEAKLAELRREYELPPLADQVRSLEQKYKAVVIKAPSSPSFATRQNQEEGKTAAPTTQSEEKEEVLRVETKLVNLNVTVLPEKPGTNLQALNKDDFTVLENGREQTIDWFAAAQFPFDITLLIDISGSTAGKLKMIRKTTRNFIKAARPSDRISIIAFDEEVTVISPLTHDRKSLLESVEKIKSRGGSKVWDALAFALNQTNEVQNSNSQNRERRSAIVFMTDGEDNTFVEHTEPSNVLFADLLEKVRHSSALIVPIHLDTRNTFGLSEKLYAGSRRALNLLAEESGGLFYQAKDVDDLEGVYPQVIYDLSKVYSIGYSPSNPERDNVWRSVKVNIKKYPNLTIRTRKGYYAQ
ncbi:MAG: VWA domain-containing protein [Acidobacteriota bacterium]|nr:VWA domain-containing protein [Acidobacteriota bacterium]